MRAASPPRLRQSFSLNSEMFGEDIPCMRAGGGGRRSRGVAGEEPPGVGVPVIRLDMQARTHRSAVTLL